MVPESSNDWLASGSESLIPKEIQPRGFGPRKAGGRIEGRYDVLSREWFHGMRKLLHVIGENARMGYRPTNLTIHAKCLLIQIRRKRERKDL